MNPSIASRAGMALLLVAVLVLGVILGSAIAAFGRGGTAPTASPTPTPLPSSAPNAELPGADAEGHELARLPRYPDSIRTEYEISIDDRYRLTAVEYLADASIEEVRAYYQRVMDQHGWERADITYAAGEWTYVLVDGSTEALVELEQWNGLIEIDLQISEPIAPTKANPTQSTQPATQAPDPDDEDDADDDGDGDDGDDGDDIDDRDDDTEG